MIIKKLLSFSIAAISVAAFAFLAAQPVSSESGITSYAAEMSSDYAGYYITKGVKDWLNVRRAPDTSSEIIGRLYPDMRIEVISSDGKWAYLDYYGQKGYASMDYLQKQADIMRPDKNVKGDINSDGQMDIADMTLLEKWLMGDASADISDWENADLNADGKMNTFDRCLMQKLLINVSDSHDLIDGTYYLNGFTTPSPMMSVVTAELSTANDQLFFISNDRYENGGYTKYSFITNFNIEYGRFSAYEDLYDEQLEISGDGDTLKIVHKGRDNQTFTEKYIRKDEAVSTVNSVPNEHDPDSPNGEIEKNISYFAKEQLGFPIDHVLTEEECRQVTGLRMTGIGSLDGIEYFPNLEYLSIAISDITDITPIAGLTKLKSIDLSFCMIEEIPDLSALTQLTDLWLGYGNISDISPVTKISSLKYLGLIGNHITSVAPIKDMKNLRSLNLGYNPVTDWEVIKDNKALCDSLSYEYSHYCEALEKAKEVVRETVDDSMSDLEKEVRLSQWIMDNIDYENDIVDTDGSDHPTYMALIENKAICRHYADAASLLMTLAGLEVRTFVNPNIHSWNAIKLDDKWYEFDCTYDDNASKPDEWTYFNKSRTYTNKMDSDHKLPNVYNYPIAESSMMMADYLKYVQF